MYRCALKNMDCFHIADDPAPSVTPVSTLIPTEVPTPIATDVPTGAPTPITTDTPTESPTPIAIVQSTESSTPDATDTTTESPTPNATDAAPTNATTTQVQYLRTWSMYRHTAECSTLQRGVCIGTCTRPSLVAIVQHGAARECAPAHGIVCTKDVLAKVSDERVLTFEKWFNPFSPGK